MGHEFTQPREDNAVRDRTYEIAVMWDTWAGAVLDSNIPMFNHVPGGCNVLFMDGHVEFLKYPGPYPASPEAAGIIRQYSF